jgi:hypothetical protein
MEFKYLGFPIGNKSIITVEINHIIGEQMLIWANKSITIKIIKQR